MNTRNWLPLLLLATVASQPALAVLDSGSGVGARELTFEQRVRAQEAIEQVYWSHRVWPRENPGSKPPLSTVMPDAVIRAKVVDYLKKSNALDTWWLRPITAEQLQAEMDRMAKSTRDATVLRELFEALGSDPFVIAETLARQTLAERLIRNWYAYDTRFHGAVRERAEHALAGPKNIASLKTRGGEYHETLWVRSQDPTGRASTKNEVHIDPEAWAEKISELKQQFDGRNASNTLPVNTLSSLQESPNEFSVVMVLESTDDRVRVASVVWAKTGFEAWWASQALAVEAGSEEGFAAPLGSYVAPAVVDSACTPDTWRPTKMEVPDARGGHTAVWTGAEMIVWGGGYTPSGGRSNTGGRYSPATDTWTATSTGTNVPEPRYSHTAVWTGTEMIVWGGAIGGGVFSTNTGGRYSPMTDTWTATSTGNNVPAARKAHTAVWTGTQMIVWGGLYYDGSGGFFRLNTGGRYDPAADAWTATSTGTNVPAVREAHTAVWTGTEMIVWGGSDNAALNSGGRYNPATDVWTATSTGTNLPSARYYHTAIWTGTQMIVWGGYSGSVGTNTGGRFTPSTNSWTATNTGPNLPSARYYHTAIWSGTQMIVWGGYNGSVETGTGGRFTPSTNSWTTMSIGPSARYRHTAIWTGTEMIVWGGATGSGSEPLGVNTGGRYNPSTNTWAATATATSMPSARSGHTAVWTGTEMIVWGGGYSDGAGGGVNLNTGGRYSPATDMWTAMSIGPSARHRHTAIWTGTEMTVWGGWDNVALNSGGRYNPATNTWATTSTGTNLPSARYDHTAVWTGTEMIVWGGDDGSSGLNTGARYSPSTDTWTATSTGTNVPAPRSGHTVVWTGTEMIVWGGGYDTGGRYSPATDTWTATSTGTNVPYSLYNHTAVWTGTEMIVWGGTAPGPSVNTGGRYNPATDVWTATSTGTDVPSGRAFHTAVWTGTEMIIWGGSDNTGGRYSPATDTWTATSTGGASTPAVFYGHTAVWTGTEMIVWGGYPYTATGGLYCVDICGSSVVCGDGNGCTDDTCSPVSGCVFTNNTAPCSDGNACTTGDTCGSGVCTSGTTITAPPETQDVAVAADKATYSWTAAAFATQYDVVRGSTGAFPVGPGGGDEVCFDNLAGPTLSDQAVPEPGNGFWYLSRGENSCGIGPYGTQGVHGAPGAPRTTTTCP